MKQDVCAIKKLLGQYYWEPFGAMLFALQFKSKMLLEKIVLCFG